MKLIAISTLAILAAAAPVTSVFAQDTPEQPASEQPAAGQPAAGAEAQPQTDNQPSAMVLVPIDNDDTPIPALNLMAGQVEDMMVIGSDQEEIGEIDQILGNQNGVPQAVVVEVGGFLGLGEKRIILMLNQLSLDLGRLRTTLTQNEISEMPEYQG